MAYYNANEVIKLTRKAMGLTQEELCEGICEVVTLSRIENGHTSVKRSTYKKLMEKMGRIPDTRYAVCVSKDGVLLEDRLEYERAFKRYDYETAEYYLQRIKENADDNLLTRQYIMRETALVDYALGRIMTEELVKRLDVALKVTAPHYVSFLDGEKLFPFSVTELMILASKANAYRKMNEVEQSIQLYRNILCCLNARYIGDPDNCRMQIAVRNSLAIAYEEQGKNITALEEIEECLKKAIQYNCGHVMATLLSAKAFNLYKLVESKGIDKSNISEIKRLSQQAYYIAAARVDKKVMLLVEEFKDILTEHLDIMDN